MIAGMLKKHSSELTSMAKGKTEDAEETKEEGKPKKGMDKKKKSVIIAFLKSKNKKKKVEKEEEEDEET